MSLIRRSLQLGRAILVRAASAAVTAGLAIFVARVYGVEYSGRLYFLLSSIAVVGILTRLGAEQHLTARVTPLARQNPRATRGHFFAAVVANGLILAAMGLVAAVVSLVWGVPTPGLLQSLPSGAVLLPAVFGFNVIWITAAYIRALGNIAASMLVEGALISVALCVFLWANAGNGPSMSSVALFIAVLGGGLLLVMLGMYARDLACGHMQGLVKASFHGALGFSSVTATNAIIVWGPIQVLGVFATAADVGVYNAAFRVTMLVGAFGVIIKGTAIRTVLAGAPHDGGHPSIPRARDTLTRSGWITLVLLAASTPLFLVPSMMGAIFGPEFTAGSALLPIMLAAQCLNVGGYLVETMLVIARERRILLINSLVTATVAVPVTPFLAHDWGARGVAWAFAIIVVAARLHAAWALLRLSSSPVSRQVQGGWSAG